MDLAQVLADLDRRKGVLDGHRPLPPVTVRSLFEALRVEHTYASNAIEGNSLTLQETSVVLEGLTVAGKRPCGTTRRRSIAPRRSTTSGTLRTGVSL
jgi:Fic family protein